MYKLIKELKSGNESVIRTNDGAYIPFDPANSDYQTFKLAVLNQQPGGATVDGDETFSLNVDPNLSILEDADGVQMTIDQAKEYVRNLP